MAAISQKAPIIINGAGIAGLSLARVLQNANVPFEIFERHTKDSPLRTRRQVWFDWSPDLFPDLPQRLNIAFKNIARPRFGHNSSRLRTQHFIGQLNQGIDVHWGHNLHQEGINIAGGAITPKYAHEKIIKIIKGSMLVGADGLFSTVRRHHSANFLDEFLFQLPAVFLRAGLRLPVDVFKDEILPHLDEHLSAQMLRDHTLLSLEFQRLVNDPHVVELSFHFSRMAKTFQEYREFHGLWPHQRDQTFPEPVFDPSIAREIFDFGPLPNPFEVAFEAAMRSKSVYKFLMPTVQHDPKKIVKKLSVHKQSAPAVIIGDAAHATPDFLDQYSIAHAALDGVMLGETIVAAMNNEEQFARVPQTFYDLCARRWAGLNKAWTDTWMTKHDLPAEYEGPEGILPPATVHNPFVSQRVRAITKAAKKPWIAVEEVYRRPREDHDPPDDPATADFYARITTQKEFSAARIARQQAGMDPSMNKVRQKYGEGADKNAQGLEARYSNSWDLDGLNKDDPGPGDEECSPAPIAEDPERPLIRRV